MLRLLLAFSILTFSGWCAAGEPLRAMQGLSGTAVHSFDSAINEHRYHIIVRPPQTRPADAVTYPTVYLLDGGALFPMLAAYTNYLRHEQAVPELLIVGVSYATDDWQQGNHRSVDYTAPSDERDCDMQQHDGGK